MTEVNEPRVATFKPGADITLSQLGNDLRAFVRSHPMEWVQIDLRDLVLSVNIAELDVRILGRWEKVLRTLESARAVSIAVISADSSHISWEIALACDYRVVDGEPEVPWPGVNSALPGMWLYRLVRLVGRANTRRIFHAGSPVQAGWAKGAGLVDEVGQEVEKVIAAFKSNDADSVTIKLRSQLVSEADEVSYEQALGVHLAAMDRTLRQNRLTAHDI